MRFIPTTIHGILDYLLGAILILAPWIFGFADGRAEATIPIVLGLAVIAYSLFTDYELALVRKIDMRTHLMLDIVGGIFLAVSPWLFGFSQYVYLPHLIVGILEVVVAVCTNLYPMHVKQQFKAGMAGH